MKKIGKHIRHKNKVVKMIQIICMNLKIFHKY
jgi:hypothetical protein